MSRHSLQVVIRLPDDADPNVDPTLYLSRVLEAFQQRKAWVRSDLMALHGQQVFDPETGEHIGGAFVREIFEPPAH